MHKGIDDSLRFAGQVKRYHTWPVLRQQNNADHTWQVMRVYLELFGPPPSAVWHYMHLHDVDEMGTGDSPHHIKRDNPDLKAMLDAIASRWRQAVGIELPVLTDLERAKVKVCDLFEMMEFGIEEQRLGNQYAWPIIVRVNEAVIRLMHSAPFVEADRQLVVVNLTKLRHEALQPREHEDLVWEYEQLGVPT